MRIDSISLDFLHPGHGDSTENYSGPGWYVSAADADQDGHVWVIKPRKITPDQVMQIAARLDQILGVPASAVPSVTGGVINQNTRARRMARETAERYERLVGEADKARREWESYPVPPPPPLHRIYTNGAQWGCSNCTWTGAAFWSPEVARLEHERNMGTPTTAVAATPD